MELHYLRLICEWLAKKQLILFYFNPWFKPITDYFSLWEFWVIVTHALAQRSVVHMSAVKCVCNVHISRQSSMVYFWSVFYFDCIRFPIENLFWTFLKSTGFQFCKPDHQINRQFSCQSIGILYQAVESFLYLFVCLFVSRSFESRLSVRAMNFSQ